MDFILDYKWFFLITAEVAFWVCTIAFLLLRYWFKLKKLSIFVFAFTAGWIGVYDEKNRARCIELGKKIGLYKDEKVAKGCTPSYLPEFIAIEVNKRKNN